MRAPFCQRKGATEEMTAAAVSIRVARTVVVAVVGSSVLVFGVVLLVTPGPGSIVIPLGLAILATEFVWARRLLHAVRKLIRHPRLHARMKERAVAASESRVAAVGSHDRSFPALHRAD